MNLSELEQCSAEVNRINEKYGTSFTLDLNVETEKNCIFAGDDSLLLDDVQGVSDVRAFRAGVNAALEFAFRGCEKCQQMAVLYPNQESMSKKSDFAEIFDDSDVFAIVTHPRQGPPHRIHIFAQGRKWDVAHYVGAAHGVIIRNMIKAKGRSNESEKTG